MSKRLRGAIAFATSVIILTLLGLTLAPTAAGYSYLPARDGRPLWAQMPDFGQRVHVMIKRSSIAPDPGEKVPMEIEGQRQDEPVLSSAVTGMQRTFLVTAAMIFAVVGLFVLAWGRDRASLWLGLFCATFASPLLKPYGVLPAWGELAVYVLTSIFALLSLFALYGFAEAVACRALGTSAAERIVKFTRLVVILVLVLVMIPDLGHVLLPVVARTAPPDWFSPYEALAASAAIVIVFIIAPLAVLAAAALWSKDDVPRRNAAIILAVTAVGLGGVIVSTYQSLTHGQPPHFGWAWFTIVLIPIGFAITIPWLKVVDVRFVVSRALKLALMTAFVTFVIVTSETLVRFYLGKNSTLLDTWQGEIATAFFIVLAFTALDRYFGEWARRVVYRRENQRVKSLRTFAHGAAFYKMPEALLDDVMTEMTSTLGACRAAVVQEDNKDYTVLRRSSPDAYAGEMRYDDRAFVALRSDAKRVNLAAPAVQPSVLGRAGFAFPMADFGLVRGALVVGARDDDAEDQYATEELDALDDVAQRVGDRLFRMQAQRVVRFVRAVATGELGDGDVAAGARDLQNQGLLHVDD